MSETRAKVVVAPGDRTVIGISFGNTNSSIAFTKDDKAEVIANEDGDRQIPTILSYVHGEEYYGQQAKNFLVRNPNNTIACFRDFLGKDFASVDVSHIHASAHAQDRQGTVSFSVTDHEGEGAEDEEVKASSLSVSEVSTRYLRRLLQSASDYLGSRVTSAVITIPTNLGDRQIEALMAVAEAAELEVLQLISESVASVLAHSARIEDANRDRMIVVVDIGGTRSNVSVIAGRSGMYTVLATAHDYDLHGSALDKVLVDYFADEFVKKHGGEDPRTNARSLAKLKQEAESSKKALSLGTNASFSVESLSAGIDLQSTINRTRYEMLARPVLEPLNRLVVAVVNKAGRDVLDIDEVILSGGTAHTPRIASNLTALFPARTTIVAPSTSTQAINPSELQARGAALQASLIQEYEARDIQQSTHAAVTTVAHVTNAIGVVMAGSEGKDVFVPIVQPDTAVPARRIAHFPSTQGGDLFVKIAEGYTHVNVIKPEPKARTNGTTSKATRVEAADEDEDESEESDGDEQEEKLENVWKIGNTLAEAVVRGVEKGGKVEVTIQVNADLSVLITARELGKPGGVRGTLAA